MVVLADLEHSAVVIDQAPRHAAPVLTRNLIADQGLGVLDTVATIGVELAFGRRWRRASARYLALGKTPVALAGAGLLGGALTGVERGELSELTASKAPRGRHAFEGGRREALVALGRAKTTAYRR